MDFLTGYEIVNILMIVLIFLFIYIILYLFLQKIAKIKIYQVRRARTVKDFKKLIYSDKFFYKLRINSSLRLDLISEILKNKNFTEANFINLLFLIDVNDNCDVFLEKTNYSSIALNFLARDYPIKNHPYIQYNKDLYFNLFSGLSFLLCKKNFSSEILERIVKSTVYIDNEIDMLYTIKHTYKIDGSFQKKYSDLNSAEKEYESLLQTVLECENVNISTLLFIENYVPKLKEEVFNHPHYTIENIMEDFVKIY